MDRKIEHQPSTLTLFNDPKQITFNNITGEHNYRKCSVLNALSYMFLLISIILQFLFLASDVFTLVQIYALKNWDDFHTITYIPILAYKIVFTTCIGISFLYFIFTWILGFIIQRRNRVVPSYLHTGARQIDSIKNYERFCIYEEISTKNFNKWFALSIYSAYHYEIINWLLADSPRQILNGATIAFSVSNKFTSVDIGGIISAIAKNDKEEAVLLSFMFFSFVIWLCFTFKNLIIILSSVCFIPVTKKKNQKKFNKYCADLVAESVSDLYSKKAEIKEEELSKRRKVPSFMNTYKIDDFNDNDDNNDFTLDNNNSSESFSIDKSNPFDIILTELPASHSRTNLLNTNNNKSRSHLHSDTFLDVPEEDDPFDNQPTNSAHPFNNNLNVRDSYIYVPSNVFEESYHNNVNTNSTNQRNIPTYGEFNEYDNFDNHNIENNRNHANYDDEYFPSSGLESQYVNHDKDNNKNNHTQHTQQHANPFDISDDDADSKDTDYPKSNETQRQQPQIHNSQILYGSRGLGTERRDML